MNQYTNIEGATPSYDLDGNATSYPLPAMTGGNATLVWDAERCDRIGSIIDGGKAVARRAKHAMPRMLSQNRLIEVKDGTTTVATGTKKDDFSHRFSTKPLDAETGLYYYGYRYYDPVTGSWPSRDPIEEAGGLNLYGFIGNDGIDQWDWLGLEEGTLWYPYIEGQTKDFDEKINHDPSIHNKSNPTGLNEYVDGGQVFATFKVGAWFTATSTSFKGVGAAQIHRWRKSSALGRAVNTSGMKYLNSVNLRRAQVEGSVSCDQDDGHIIISPAGLAADKTMGHINAGAMFSVSRDDANSKSALVHIEAAASFLYDVTVSKENGITIGVEIGFEDIITISGEGSSSTTITSKVFKDLKIKRTVDIPYKCKCTTIGQESE